MAGYNAAIDVGHALGAGAAILPTVLTRLFRVSNAHGATFVLCGAAIAVSAMLYSFVGEQVEHRRNAASGRAVAAIDAHTRRTVLKLTALFGLDSTGGGFLSSALVAYWFFERYGMTESQLAGLSRPGSSTSGRTSPRPGSPGASAC